MSVYISVRLHEHYVRTSVVFKDSGVCVTYSFDDLTALTSAMTLNPGSLYAYCLGRMTSNCVASSTLPGFTGHTEIDWSVVDDVYRLDNVRAVLPGVGGTNVTPFFSGDKGAQVLNAMVNRITLRDVETANRVIEKAVELCR